MGMNVFRIAGDLSHMLSILMLLKLVFIDKNGRGVSYRSQELFLLLFLTRYTDLFTTYYSLYNSTAKLFYILSTAALLIRIKLKTNPQQNNGGSSTTSMHDEARDVFPHVGYLVIPCFLLASLYYCMQTGGWNNRNFQTMELLWTVSIWLESVAIIPQLVLLQKYRKIQPLLAHAILFMGLYRVLYILNWFYRSQTERWYKHQWNAYGAGTVQVLLYADFFYSYLTTTKCKFGAANASRSTSSSAATASVGNGGNSNAEGGRERQNSGDDHLTYNPILQNRVCCCNHVAKEDEDGEGTRETTEFMEIQKDDNQHHSVSNKMAKRNTSLSRGTSPPPTLIFSFSFVGRLVMTVLALLILLVLTAVMLVVHDHYPAVSMALVALPTLAAIVWGVRRGRGRKKTNNSSPPPNDGVGDSKKENIMQTQDGTMVISGSDNDLESPLLEDK